MKRTILLLCVFIFNDALGRDDKSYTSDAYICTTIAKIVRNDELLRSAALEEDFASLSASYAELGERALLISAFGEREGKSFPCNYAQLSAHSNRMSVLLEHRSNCLQKECDSTYEQFLLEDVSRLAEDILKTVTNCQKTHVEVRGASATEF